jgi:uncharacterized membrane protein
MWHHGNGFFPVFPILFFALLIGFLIFRIVMFRRYGSPWIYGGYRGRGWKDVEGSLDAAVILKKRLASGEIDETEYRRLLEIIKE